MADKPNERFDFDLANGEARESAFVRHLLDLDLGTTVEHKADYRVFRIRPTGNVCVEFQQKGRPSGIATSEASFYAIEFDDNCWVTMPTERLKAIARLAYKQFGATNTGDNENVSVCFPFAWLGRLYSVDP